MRLLSFAALLVVASLAIAASPASAAEVVAQCDDSEAANYLQDAFDASGPNDVITLEDGEICNDGEYTLPSHTIVFQGAGGGEPEIMDGNDEGRILRGNNVGATVIRNLTFRDGDYSGSGAAIEIQGDSTPTLSNLTIVDSHSGDRAPVTIATSTAGGTVTVEESTFGGSGEGDDNSAARGGGLLINTAHAIVLHHNNFIGNHAQLMGGGAVLELGRPAPELERALQGGIETGAPVTVTDNTFSGNRVEPDQGFPFLLGGGLAILADSQGFRSVVQSGNTFSDNAILPSFVFDNRTTEGGGFGGYFAGGGEYTQASVLSTNDRYVENSIEQPTLPQETIKPITQDGGFSAEIYGGGLAVSGRELEFEGRNLVAAGNEIAFGWGGGVSSDRGPLQFGGPVEGNAIASGKVEQGNTLRLLDSTIDANKAPDGDGAAINGRYDDHLVVHNGIVFDNTSERGRQINGFDDGGTTEILFTDYCAEDDPPVPALAPAPGDGNICADPKLVDPPNGDVHQQKDLSPTLDVGSDALVPVGLITDWDRPTADPRIADSGTDGARVDMGADELVQAAPAPPPAAAPPPPQGAVLGAQQRSCVSRREFRIRLRVPRGKTAVSATVRVNGKQVKVVRGRRLRAPVILRGLPKGKITVRITIRLKGGKRVTGTRRYNTCIPRLPGDGPPPV